ncbi:hypothetical protein U7230_13905 [Carboxydochorda subterranea]|uniref:CopG family transcriptional regulator n=1 Tax=Carboxydichorda subterranea TaxID=3109565 RepID=A0ABZ1BWK9_9FIRM|nr:hypothetical protein [Limnochorda sp. L945t]WRP17162.1 hypothetical protein U7230_13905 [Limnochorda sp. L945t]
MNEHVAMNIRLPKDLWERLRRYAFEHHRRQADVIRDALARFLDAEERKERKP